MPDKLVLPLEQNLLQLLRDRRTSCRRAARPWHRSACPPPRSASGRAGRSSPGRSRSDRSGRGRRRTSGSARCCSSSSRIDCGVAAACFSSSGGTSGGGGGGGLPSSVSRTHLPRSTGTGAMRQRRDRQHAGHAQQAAAMAVLRQIDPLELLLHVVEPAGGSAAAASNRRTCNRSRASPAAGGSRPGRTERTAPAPASSAHSSSLV